MAILKVLSSHLFGCWPTDQRYYEEESSNADIETSSFCEILDHFSYNESDVYFGGDKSV